MGLSWSFSRRVSPESAGVGFVWLGFVAVSMAVSDGQPCLGPLTIGPQYSAHVPISADELRALGARVRAEAEATGELAKPGLSRLGIPREARDALLEYLHSGAYEEAARACIADEPEL